MTTFNALPYDIFSRILEYNTHTDISSLSLGCKQNSVDVIQIRELTVEKQIREKTNFLKTLGLYIDKYNNDSEQYIFDIPKIKEYLKSSHLNDKSLVVNGTNDFAVDGKMVKITSNKSSHIENMIGTVIEFLPECAYSLIESIAHSDSNNTEILLDGMIIYNCDSGVELSVNKVYILINNQIIYKTTKSQYEKYQDEKYQGKPVTVVLGSNITSISYSAFQYCESLTSVIIGNSVKSVSEYAFNGCASLTSVIIGNSVKSIGEYAFNCCFSLTSVIIGDSVTSIGDGIFTHCRSLTSVIIGNSVTSIGESAFDGCFSLTSVIIGNSVTSIGDYAFKGCSSLTTVVIPDSVTSIGESAFYECENLTSVIIGNSVTSIGDYAFEDCFSLTSVIIGDSVMSIGAFYTCRTLVSVTVTIPHSVTSIGDGAFCENTTIIRR